MADNSSNSLDPLTLLRNYTISQTPIILLTSTNDPTVDLSKTATIKFTKDNQTFPRDQPTNYIKKGKDEFYSLGSLIFFLKNKDMSFYSYLKSAVEVGLPGVSFADKGDIVSYLTGKTVTSNSIIKGKGSTAASAAAGSGGSGSAGGVKRHHDGKSIGSGNNTEGDSGSGVGGIGVEGDKDGGDVDGLVAAKRLKSTSGIDTSTSASGGGALLDISAEADIDASKAIEIRERVLVTSDMALKGSKSFAYVLSVVKDVFSSKSQPQGSSGSHHGSSGVGSGGYGGSESKGAHGKRKRKDPIIIVPAAATALLNMYNIKEFLQDQTFVDSKEQMDKIQIKPREVFVERKLGSASSKPIRYRVIDSTQGLGADEWDNIACVFTQGAEWQFKNWQWKTPDEVFKNCLGIFPRFPDINIRGNVQTWNVQVLDIERSKRHTDRAKVLKLWENIERYIATNKSHLLA